MKYYLVNNTIQKFHFHYFYGESQYYLVNNHFQRGRLAPKWSIWGFPPEPGNGSSGTGWPRARRKIYIIGYIGYVGYIGHVDCVVAGDIIGYVGYIGYVGCVVAGWCWLYWLCWLCGGVVEWWGKGFLTRSTAKEGRRI